MQPTSRSPRVLAVVLNWCAANESAECVVSLMTDSAVAADILIVDNASPDGSGDVLKNQFPQHHYLQTGANLGYAGGNQRAVIWGLERNYEYILIINDDATVLPGCIGAMLDALEREPRAAAAAPTILHHGTSVIWFAGGEFSALKAMGSHTRAGQQQPEVSRESINHVSFLTGCVLMLRADALRECGGFREEFFAYVEDLELSYRFRHAGWTLLHVAGAVATHKVPYPAPADSAFAIRQRDVNRRRLVNLHYSWPMRLGFMGWFYPTRIIHLARFAARADRARVLAIWKGMFDRV